MIDRLTKRVDATGADARVSTLLGKAGFVTGTLGIDDALRIDAHCDAVPHFALTVVGARRWTARIGFKLRVAFHERIADQRGLAAAQWAVIDRLTSCLNPTDVLRAGIHASIVYAGFVSRTVGTDHAFRMAARDARRHTLQTG